MRMGDEGVEHPALTAPKTAISETASAKSGAPESEKPSSDPDLALILDRWPNLPEHVRQAVLALVQTSPDKEQTP